MNKIDTTYKTVFYIFYLAVFYLAVFYLAVFYLTAFYRTVHIYSSLKTYLNIVANYLYHTKFTDHTIIRFLLAHSLNVVKSPKVIFPLITSPSLLVAVTVSAQAVTTDKVHYINSSNSLPQTSLQLTIEDWSFSNDISFDRIYNSANSTWDFGLGPGWQTNFHVRILNASTDHIDLLSPAGLVLTFTKSGQNMNNFQKNSSENLITTWSNTDYGYIELVNSTKQLSWYSKDDLVYHFHGPYLVAVAENNSNVVTLLYKNNQLTSVKHLPTDQEIGLKRSKLDLQGQPIESRSISLLNDIFQLDSSRVNESDTFHYPIESIHLPDGNSLLINNSSFDTEYSQQISTESYEVTQRENLRIQSLQYASVHLSDRITSSLLLTDFSEQGKNGDLIKKYSFEYQDSGNLLAISYKDNEISYRNIIDEQIYDELYSCQANQSLSEGIFPTDAVIHTTIDETEALDREYTENATISDETTNEQCESSNESDAQNLPVSLTTSHSLPGTVRLDVIPDGCNSYFDYHSPISRGSAIERAIAHNERYETAVPTVQWFPSIDFTQNGTAIVQVSRDLTAATYTQNPDILYRLLLDEAASLQRNFIDPLENAGFVTASDRNSSTTLYQSEISAYRLELIVQQDRMNAAQSEVIRQASTALASEYQIELQVIEIP